MNLWTTVLLAWVSVNLLLVTLMWRYQRMKEQAARERVAAQAASSAADTAAQPCAHAALGWTCRPPAVAATPRTARLTSAPRRHRVVSFTSAEAAPPAWLRSAAQAVDPNATPAPTSCRMQELRDEIRVLKLTVAELALEKAMLSAAMSRRKALS
ncbi:MAG: hypothetical protein EKK53_13465 [Burkholderiales bacterium]|nr:MAG: hypothetical protein EKK53_13465 [Burkholderiales bacterium]